MRLFSFIAMSVILCGFSYACTVEKSGDSSSDLLILLGATQSVSRSSTPGTNLAQVGFDGIPVFSNMPVTACDVDNSSAQGIIVDLTSVMGGAYVYINPVPLSASRTFPAGLELDLHLFTPHMPADSLSCTLVRSENTASRYLASLNPACNIMGHTFDRLDINCRPN